MTGVPQKARTAGILFLVYAGLVLFNAVVWQTTGADAAPRDLLRAAVRVLGVVVMAVGLFRGARWAWWLGVVFPGFWLLMSAVGASALAVASSRGVDVGVSISSLILVLAVAMLAAGWGLLLTREVRRAYLGE